MFSRFSQRTDHVQFRGAAAKTAAKSDRYCSLAVLHAGGDLGEENIPFGEVWGTLTDPTK